jgi:hypothetical protein
MRCEGRIVWGRTFEDRHAAIIRACLCCGKRRQSDEVAPLDTAIPRLRELQKERLMHSRRVHLGLVVAIAGFALVFGCDRMGTGTSAFGDKPHVAVSIFLLWEIARRRVRPSAVAF